MISGLISAQVTAIGGHLDIDEDNVEYDKRSELFRAPLKLICSIALPISSKDQPNVLSHQ